MTGTSALVVSTTILVLTYAVIISDKINRSIVALLGACVMIVSGVINQEQAIEGIDFNTLALLAGMMKIVAITRRTGLFEYVAISAARTAKGNPASVMILLSIITAVFSAFLDNVTTVLLVVPVTLAIASKLKIPAYPLLFAEIFASNIGGTSTLIGDPPNIIIGSAADLSFNDFAVALAPVIVVIMAVQLLITHVVWGRKMRADAEHRAAVIAMNPREQITDWKLLRQCQIVIALVIGGFILQRDIHLEPGTIALFGAAVLMLLDNIGRSAEDQTHRVGALFAEVEWITLFFFIGLFIVIAGVENAGLLEILATDLVAATGGDLEITGLAILWASAILSAIIDNIPFVATMIPLIKEMAPTFGGPEAIIPLWWCLSLGACLGGNGTLIGASANLTVAGIAERNGVPFKFLTFTAYAFPMMLVSIAIAHVYVLWRFF